MTEDQALALTGALGGMTLVVASLMTRRLPMQRMALLALAWAAIFGMGYGLIWMFRTL